VSAEVSAAILLIAVPIAFNLVLHPAAMLPVSLSGVYARQTQDYGRLMPKVLLPRRRLTSTPSTLMTGGG
jgi:hypothetical protein